MNYAWPRPQDAALRRIRSGTSSHLPIVRCIRFGICEQEGSGSGHQRKFKRFISVCVSHLFVLLLSNICNRRNICIRGRSRVPPTTRSLTCGPALLAHLVDLVRVDRRLFGSVVFQLKLPTFVQSTAKVRFPLGGVGFVHAVLVFTRLQGPRLEKSNTVRGRSGNETTLEGVLGVRQVRHQRAALSRVLDFNPLNKSTW